MRAILPLSLAMLVVGCADAPPPAARGIVFVSSRPPEHEGEEIYVINADGTGERRLTYSGAGKSSVIPQWSPDGNWIAFASNREDDDGRHSIYIMDGDGHNVQRLTPVGSVDYFPHWSPDGTRIAFMSSRDGDAEIYVMAADGSNPQKFSDNDSFDGVYSWSPDGQYLAFTSWRDGERKIYIMGADGSNVRMIGPGHGGTFSDDGRYLTYMDYPASMERGAPCYGRMDLEGVVVEQWCGPQGNLGVRHAQCWSTDRTRVAFVATPNGSVPFPAGDGDFVRLELYVANADGSGLQQLTDNEYYEGHCTW